MARVLAEGAVEIVPDDTGFAGELRSDLNRDLTAATAGLDKTVRVRVTTDVDTAEKQIRAGIANVQRLSEQLLQRIQTRSLALFTATQAQLVKLRAKIQEAVQKTRDKVNQLLAPFWAKLRVSMAAAQAGWARIATAATRAAGVVRDRFTAALGLVSRGWQVVADGASQAASRVAVAFEPALVRVRRAIEALSRGWDTVRDTGARAFTAIEGAASAAMVRIRRGWELQNLPLRALRAYGQATFRIIGEAAATQFERARTVGERAFARVQAAGVRASGRISAGLSRVTRPLRDFKRGLDDISLGFDKSASRATHFGVVAGVGARLAASRVVELTRKFADFTDKVTGGAGLIGRDFRNIGTAVRLVGRATDATGRGFSKLGDRMKDSGRLGKIAGGVLDGVGKIMQGVSGTAGTLTGSLKLVGEGLLDLGKSALSGAGLLVGFGAKAALVGVIAGAVTYAIGGIAAAFAGLPALIGAAAVSLAVFALGMDGIKKAYETGLKPALDKLKTQVSEVFERTLTPAFKRLSDELIPQITGQMKGLAQAFADGAVQIIDMVNRADNIKKIQALIDNTATAVRGQLVPALKNVIQSFIDIGANAAIMRDMVGIFTDLANKTAAWLSEMERTGQAQSSIENLRSILGKVEDLFFRLATAATQFFDEATPGMEALVDSIRPNEDIMRRLGKAFGDTAAAAGRFIEKIPPSTFDAITSAAEHLASALGKIADNQAAVDLVDNLAKVAEQGATVIDGLASAVGGVADAIGTVTGGVDEFLADLRDLTGAVPPGADAQEILAEKTRETGAAAADAGKNIESGYLPPVESLPAKSDAAFEGVQRAAEKLKPLPGTAAAAGQGTANGILNNINPLPGQADAAFGGVNAAGDKLKPLPGTATAAAQGANTGVQTGLAPMPATADAAFQGVNDAARTGMDGAASAAEAGAKRVSDSVRTGLEGAGAAAEAAMPRVAAAVQSAMDAAGQSADTGGKRIGDGIRNGVQAATDAVNSQMPEIGNTVEAAMQAAGASAEVGGQRIGDGVRAGAQLAADVTQAAMPRVSEAVRTAMDQAAQAAQAGGDRIAASLRGATEQAAAAAEAGMTRIAAAVRTGMAQAVEAATQGGQQIRQVLQTALTAVVALVIASWQRIVAAFQAGGQQAVASARATGQQVVSTFQALAGPMYSAGYTLIQRLSAGMIAAGAAATAAAAAIAASIKAQFPSSPAKEGPLSGSGDPLRSGGTIVQRLADGMAGNASAVQAAITPILSSLVSRVNSVVAIPEVGASLPASSPGAAGRRNIIEDAVRATATTTSGDGGVLAELKAQTAALIALRGDVTASGYSASMLERLDKLIEVMSDGSSTAGEKAQSLRDLAGLGAF